MKDLHVRLLAGILVACALSLVAYKVLVLHLPLTPTPDASVWHVEARISFTARGVPVKVQFFIPSETPNFTLIDEDFVAGSYGLAVDREKGNRKAQWSGRRPLGSQTLYYRILAHQESEDEILSRPALRRPVFPKVPDYDDTVGPAVEALLADVRAQSADTATFAWVLLKKLAAKSADENVALIRSHFNISDGQIEGLRKLLAGARIPSRVVWGVRLQDGARNLVPEPWLEVYNGSEWLIFNPLNAGRGAPGNTLFWRTGSEPLVSSEGTRAPQVEIASRRSVIDVYTLAEKRADLFDSRIMDFSLLSLPLQTQNVYRVLLAVPVGALVVVLMRNVVGISTFGTFMPILIALAFRETRLLWGIALFVLLISLGLSIRFYFERLKLLLVPRLASVVTVVVLLMAGISVVSNNLGLERGLSVALFPMVIVAMTIERASIVWEENGPQAAFKQGLGTLLTAILGYMVMFNEWLSHLVFVFPELLLGVLAATLLLGRYSGYRLSELHRFRNLLREQRP